MLNPGTASGIPLAQRHSGSLFQDSKKLSAMNALYYYLTVNQLKRKLD